MNSRQRRVYRRDRKSKISKIYANVSAAAETSFSSSSYSEYLEDMPEFSELMPEDKDDIIEKVKEKKYEDDFDPEFMKELEKI